MTSRYLEISATVPIEAAGQRLDQALAALLPDYSRSRLKGWIESGEILVDGATCRPRDKVSGGEAVQIRAELPQETRAEPQPLPLELVYEDRHVLVVNKPAGLVVHPGAGNPDRTLQNALLAHDPDLNAASRRDRAPARQGHERPADRGADAARAHRAGADARSA